MRPLAWSLILGLCACAESATRAPDEGRGGAGGAAGSGGSLAVGNGGAGGDASCDCLPGPHGDRVYVLSDGGEIYAYDPTANAFEYVRSLLCTGAEVPFSMAIDHTGRAWVLSASTSLIFVLDLAASSGCDVSPYTPHQADFDLFGMAFAEAPEPAACEQLFVHSFSGRGKFSEGPDSGTLGRIDPELGTMTVLGPVDYDGGELTGTADGRLFAFAGVSPAKLVEYDRKTGQALDTRPLEGLSKTNASAFAFFAGDFYFFTEATPAECVPCLEASCPADYAACKGAPSCSSELQCAIDLGDVTDACGGGMPQPMIDCLVDVCGSACLVPSSQKVSQVARLDGAGQLEVVHPQAPVRIVGAGESVCVPDSPR